MKSFPFFFLLVLLFFSCGEEEMMEPVITPDPPVFTSTEDVRNLISGEVVGSSTVNRYEDSIAIRFETVDLIEGHVYALVITTVDLPGNCQTTPCTIKDFIKFQSEVKAVNFRPDLFVAMSDSLTFDITIKEKDVTTIPFLYNQINKSDGLQDALKVEVHIGLRSKGPAIDSFLEDQLKDVATLCNVDWAYDESNTPVPIKEKHCAWIRESRHLSPN